MIATILYPTADLPRTVRPAAKRCGVSRTAYVMTMAVSRAVEDGL